MNETELPISVLILCSLRIFSMSLERFSGKLSAE
jgi:hypothetical protein